MATKAGLWLRTRWTALAAEEVDLLAMVEAMTRANFEALTMGLFADVAIVRMAVLDSERILKRTALDNLREEIRMELFLEFGKLERMSVSDSSADVLREVQGPSCSL